MEYETGARRGRIDRLRDGAKSNAALFQRGNCFDQVLEAAAQSVQLPYYKHVPVPNVVEAWRNPARSACAPDMVFKRRWCTLRTEREMNRRPEPLCDDALATNGVRASGRQHLDQDRNTDGCLSLLGDETACPRPRSDQRLVAAHRRSTNERLP
jgi:hypothetical protein